MKPGVRLDQTVQVTGVTARRSPRPFFYLRFDLDNSLLAHPADLFLHYVNRCEKKIPDRFVAAAIN